MTISIEQAEEILNSATRLELRDHAFGDAEVTWMRDDVEVAGGYFGSTAQVWLSPSLAANVVFNDADAYRLRKCGHDEVIDRNDSTGPDIYAEGTTMPGLTLEGVRRELFE
jgi:hypothetical protein